jgi:hypothetical protein
MTINVYRLLWDRTGEPPVVHEKVAEVKIVGSFFVVEFVNGETVFWPASSVDRIETDHSGP